MGGINPFGEESDSEHAWKERYKNQQFQTQTLRQQLGDVKSQLEDIQIKFEEVSKQLKTREEELSDVRQKLKSFKEVSAERERKISQLESSTEFDRVERLEKENKELKNKVENLQSQLLRGGGSTSGSDVNDISSDITKPLIRHLIHYLNPDESKYKDAFINLVENLIQSDDTETQIIAILVKYGGKGPKKRIKSMISSGFEPALKNLINKNLVIEAGEEIMLNAGSEDSVKSEDLNAMDNQELFKHVIEKSRKMDNEKLIEMLKDFRDILQERGIPLTTIFFEIRKMIERIKKNKISRTDVTKQIEQWFEKYQAL